MRPPLLGARENPGLKCSSMVGEPMVSPSSSGHTRQHGSFVMKAQSSRIVRTTSPACFGADVLSIGCLVLHQSSVSGGASRAGCALVVWRRTRVCSCGGCTELCHAARR